MSDFAKIVIATDGEQVLFYKDNSDEDGGPELVGMTVHAGITLRAGLGGFPGDDEEQQGAHRDGEFDKAGLNLADQFRAMAISATGTEAA